MISRFEGAEGKKRLVAALRLQQIVKDEEHLAADLGGQLTNPRLHWKYSWIERVFGYGIAMRTRSFLPGVKWLFIRSWDKALFRLEDRNVAIRPGNCSRKST